MRLENATETATEEGTPPEEDSVYDLGSASGEDGSDPQVGPSPHRDGDGELGLTGAGGDEPDPGAVPRAEPGATAASDGGAPGDEDKLERLGAGESNPEAVPRAEPEAANGGGAGVQSFAGTSPSAGEATAADSEDAADQSQSQSVSLLPADMQKFLDDTESDFDDLEVADDMEADDDMGLGLDAHGGSDSNSDSYNDSDRRGTPDGEDSTKSNSSVGESNKT